MVVRISPVERQQVETSHMFHMQATSKESNAIIIAESIGDKCLVLRKFFDDRPLAKLFQKVL
jgi:hypothetical protein